MAKANRLPWLERRFNFDFPTAKYPDLVERLRGTPARVEEKVGGLKHEVLVRRDQESWSIQENVGHLLDVESLWAGRLGDYMNGEEELRPADLSNRRTYEADHNRRPLTSLLGEFRRARERLVAQLDQLSEADFARIALHPRLKTPMRLCDLVLFAAEHDDCHLARMSELIRRFSGRVPV